MGESFLASLLHELKKAGQYIFLEFFTINEGRAWEAILDILKQKAHNGIEVRILYDDMGCIDHLPHNYYNLFSQCQASFSDSRHIIFADKYMCWQIPFLIYS